MKKLLYVRSALAVLLAVVLFLSVAGFKGCPGKSSSGGGSGGSGGSGNSSGVSVALPYVETALRVLDKAIPLFELNGLKTENLKNAIKIGGPLVVALKEGGDFLNQAGAFVNAFEKILADVELIKNPTTRTLVLVGLAVADEAIHDLLDQVELPSFAHLLQGDQAQAIETLKAYKAKPRLRCRAAGPVEKYKAGQFAPMDICRKYPAQTVVERVKPKN